MRLFETISLLTAFASMACAKGSVAVDDTPGPDGGMTGNKDSSMQVMDSSQIQDTSMQVDTGNCKTVPPSNLCGLDPQCGCPSNQTCDIDYQKLDGTTKCAPAGSGMIKAKCTTSANCAQGLTCVFGACRPYCSQDGSTCSQPGTNKCTQLTNGMSPIPNLLVCYLNCTLDDTNSCGGGGMGCVYGGANDVTDCRDLSAYGTTTCTQNNPNCAAGYVCLSNNMCAKWCKVGITACGGGKTCVSLNPMVKMGNTEFGVCN